MHHRSSSSNLGRKTTRRSFTKAAVLAPIAGALSATSLSAQPLLAHAQAIHPAGLSQAQDSMLVPRMELFTMGDTLYHRPYFNGKWGNWAAIPLDSSFSLESFAATVVGQTIHAFGEDFNTKKTVWFQSTNGDWSNWTLLDVPTGYFTLFAPTVTTQGDGSLDLFGMGAVISSTSQATTPSSTHFIIKDVLHRQLRNGQWSDWEVLSTAGLPSGVTYGNFSTACSWGPGRLDVFVTGTDGTIWHKWFDNGQWSNWETQGTPANDIDTSVIITASSWGSGEIDVFVTDDITIWQKSFRNGGWSGWANLNGSGVIFLNNPVASSWGTGRIDLFAYGYTSSSTLEIFHKWYDNGQWSTGLNGDGWEGLALPTDTNSIPIGGIPTSVSWMAPVPNIQGNYQGDGIELINHHPHSFTMQVTQSGQSLTGTITVAGGTPTPFSATLTGPSLQGQVTFPTASTSFRGTVVGVNPVQLSCTAGGVLGVSGPVAFLVTQV